MVSGGDGNQPICYAAIATPYFQQVKSKTPLLDCRRQGFRPGVADMKPGLVINAFILAAFHKFGGHPNPLVGLFTGDEEMDRPHHRM